MMGRKDDSAAVKAILRPTLMSFSHNQLSESLTYLTKSGATKSHPPVFSAGEI